MIKSTSMINSSTVSMWWFPLLVGTVVVIGSIFVLLPQVRQIQTNLELMNKTKAELQKAQAKVAQVSSLDMSQLTSMADLLHLALPNHKPYYETLVMLQQLTADAGVTIASFDFNPGSIASSSSGVQPKTDPGTGAVLLPIKIQIRGTINQLTQYVGSLQKALPLIQLKSVAISGKEDKRSAAITMNMLYFIDSPIKNSQVSFEPLPTFSSEAETVLDQLNSYSQAIATASVTIPVTDFNRPDLFQY